MLLEFTESINGAFRFFVTRNDQFLEKKSPGNEIPDHSFFVELLLNASIHCTRSYSTCGSPPHLPAKPARIRGTGPRS